MLDIKPVGVNNATNVSAESLNNIENGVSKVDFLLADVAEQGVTCKQLGMIPNNAIEGLSNFNKLVLAIKQGKKILCDNIYYLETLTVNNINKSINLIGINNNAKFFVKGNNFFKIVRGCEKISINSVNFESTGNFTILFTATDIFTISKIDVINCEYYGNISFFRWAAPITVNPEIIPWGIKEFNFINNKIFNTRYSFIVLSNVPFDSYNILNNKITNFEYVFFACGISNDHSFLVQILNKMDTIIVKNNKVFCEDSWWGSGDSGLYYCFVLAETQKVYYENNNVEGIKTEYLIAVYDAYLSSKYVEYKNNTWINNICFNANKTDNTLMKAKGNGVTRYYENNKFIVEESFADKFSKAKDLLRVDLYSCASDMKRWVIKNNIIDVYFLIYPASSQSIDEQWIENNTFKSTICRGYILSFFSELGKDYTPCVHTLINNIIMNSGEYDGINLLNLAKSVDYSNLLNLYSNVIISNNKVIATNLEYAIFSLYAKNVIYENNMIEVPYSPISISGGYALEGNIKELQILNSTFTKAHGKVYESRIPVVGKIEEDYTIKDFSGNSLNSGFQLNINNIIDVIYRYTREYEIISSIGHSKFSYTIDYFYDSIDGKNKVTFINSTDVISTYILGESDGNKIDLKLIGTIAGSLEIKFLNSVESSSFSLYGLLDGYKTIKVKTYTAIV